MPLLPLQLLWHWTSGQDGKRFSTALITVPKLVDSNFESVDQALQRVDYKCHWATWILDSKLAASDLSDKEEADKQNAYLIISEKVQGHQVLWKQSSWGT